ncbi:MAG: ankyrin repeat domain-containing protein [Tepidisphaeraceae bacterium]
MADEQPSPAPSSTPSSAPSPLELPAHPSIEWLKKSAKKRLTALRKTEPDATLALAQLAVAREYGFSSWRTLAAHVRTLRADPATAPGMDEATLRRTFQKAVEQRRLDDLRRCLQQDPSLANAPLFSFGGRAVHAARGHLPTIDLLLSFGADLNLRSDWWAGPWHVLETADPAWADALIARGAMLDPCSAAHLNRLDDLRVMLASDPAAVAMLGGDGCRPLHFAASVETIDLLLTAGADIDARDVDHQSTAAQWALPRPPTDGGPAPKVAAALTRIRALVDRGASVDVFLLAALGDVDRLRALIAEQPGLLSTAVGAKDDPACPDAPGRHIYVYTLTEGRTPFEVAAAFSQRAALDLLLDRADPRQRFLAACAIADEPAARAALARDPDVLASLSANDHARLANAAWAGNAAAVRLMLDLGFDPAIVPPTGGTPLHAAAWHGRADLVQLILEHPAVRSRWGDLIELTDASFQSTPLGWCCHGSTNCRNPAGDYPQVARLLLKAGARIGPNLGDASPQLRAVLGAPED